jgi:hypothetical protein
VILAKVPEGFVAELTYGEDVNWYRNVGAAGGCVVVAGGKEHQISAIDPYDSGRGRAAYPAPFRTILEVTGRNEFRLLRVDDQPGASRGPAAPGA